MDLFIGFFCLFIFVCFVVVLVISFLLRRVSVLQWQLEATSGTWNHAFRATYGRGAWGSVVQSVITDIFPHPVRP